jgi:hypothetical protein
MTAYGGWSVHSTQARTQNFSLVGAGEGGEVNHVGIYNLCLSLKITFRKERETAQTTAHRGDQMSKYEDLIDN